MEVHSGGHRNSLLTSRRSMASCIKPNKSIIMLIIGGRINSFAMDSDSFFFSAMARVTTQIFRFSLVAQPVGLVLPLI